MANSDLLASPDKLPSRADIWNETWKRLDRFLPHLFEELFPEEAKKEKEGPKVVPQEEPKRGGEATDAANASKEGAADKEDEGGEVS